MLSKDQEDTIRAAIDAIEQAQTRDVLAVDVAATALLLSDDLAVNAPHNQVVRKPVVLELMKQGIGLSYSSLERHREALVIREDCVVSMGSETVVPKGNVPDAGKTITRRYLDVFHFEDGRWRLIARQATNIATR